MRFCTRGTRDKTGERRISSRTGTNRKMPNITTTGWVKKTGISNQKPAWKAWCCESCLTSLPLPTGPYLTLYSIIIVSTSPIDMNENMKRNHKDIEWKQLFFEIPFFFGPPCRYCVSRGGSVARLPASLQPRREGGQHGVVQHHGHRWPPDLAAWYQ